jgi:hypothetical protein
MPGCDLFHAATILLTAVNELPDHIVHQVRWTTLAL